MAGPITLTQTVVDAATPKAREYALADMRVPGLFLRVRPEGRKTFVLRSATRRKTIGASPGLTLEEARQIALRILADGDDVEKDATQAMTVAELVLWFHETKGAHQRPGTIRVRKCYKSELRCSSIPPAGRPRLLKQSLPRPAGGILF